VSIAPPGWVEPARAVGLSAHDAEVATLRSESRRALDGRRLGARLIDWLIVAPFAAAAIWAWGLNLGTYALAQCLLLIYHHLFEVTTGATPGKRLLGLRVARLEDGGLPAPRQAAARGVIGIFEFGLIALLAMVATKGRRRLGDFAAGTAVVDARKHPVTPRPLFRSALAYPVVWAVPAIVACVLAARGDVPGSYRYEADAKCVARELIASAMSPSGTLSPASEAGWQVEQESLPWFQEMSAPAVWRGRHEDLVRRLTARAIEHREMAADLQRPGGARRVGFWRQRERRQLAADDAALAAQGFHGCAHRA
jgi:uncharacterized RDD family membrane protein YckC